MQFKWCNHMRSERMLDRREYHSQREQHFRFNWLDGNKLHWILGTIVRRWSQIASGHERTDASCQIDEQIVESSWKVATRVWCSQSLARTCDRSERSRMVWLIVGCIDNNSCLRSFWHSDERERSRWTFTTTFVVMCSTTTWLWRRSSRLGLELYSENRVGKSIVEFAQRFVSNEICF